MYKFYDNYWNLITYLDLQSFDSKISLLTSTYAKTQRLCNHDTFVTFNLCNNSLKLLSHTIPKVIEKDLLLKEITKTEVSKTRSKRGFMNGFGSIFKVLFGTLDAQDADYYNNAINNISVDEKQINSLLKDQIHVVKTTIENFNSTITNLEKNNNIIEANFKKIENFTNFETRSYFNLNAKQNTEEHMSFLSLLTNELDNEYSTLINAILFIKSNILHPSIMSPHQFLNELSKISSYLPVLTSFALPLTMKNVNELLSVARISVYYSQTKLIFKISNPLIAQLNYNVFNIIPLPTRFDNEHHVFLLTEYQYLAMSESKSTYIPLHNLDNCHTLSNEDTICYLNSPTYATRTKPICEVEILLNPNHIPTSCDTRVIKLPLESWYKLKSTNKWLYVLKNQIDITINCRHEKPADIEIKKNRCIIH